MDKKTAYESGILDTTDKKTPQAFQDGAPGPIDPATGQHTQYWVLSEAERQKGFVRPVRNTYLHKKCRSVTSMGRALAETYARDPKFYGYTFCVICGTHYPVSEFLWDNTNEEVGS